MQIAAYCAIRSYLHILPGMRRKPGALVPLETEICVCAAELLQRGVDEFHGYELAKTLAETFDRRSLAAYGTLYRALGRLQEMGMLSSRWENPSAARRDNRPPRRLYSLTMHGRVTAREAIAQRKAQRAARTRKGWAPA
jgi:DNA-binding PadR family transcriptional regulator